MNTMPELKTIRTPTLEIAYHDHGASTGWPVILSHGFPYSIHAYEEVAPLLFAQGARVVIPYLRGYGPTRFLSPSTMRSGQQAALGTDLLALIHALGIEKAIIAGFDWGGLASCVVAALWPDRVEGLVSYAGYDIIDRPAQRRAAGPGLECVMWYQHLFQSERGRECLQGNRKELCRILWEQWSPTWEFSDEVFEKTAASFDNPDFVDVVIHCYRHVLGSEEGDPKLQELEERLAKRPKIRVPCITLDGTKDPLKPGGTASHNSMFTGRYERWERDVGHAFPMEAPGVFAEAVLKIHQWACHQ
ncbi:Alpha/Beta hydrolase protein [Pseudomassariella vexata]|uniref:Alpha/Beta hydrolase protein n=1 Tax=Pseudomassariella vexata TaxID=1141098 RepID=A0A1Y2EBS3_9PEZI|nr:Alpha/Beta hydrolase protein [Pseudomassariella vexata]ORY68992.1 Alpha/Beta hydrolase protein [Pseudomassariella vexata]